VKSDFTFTESLFQTNSFAIV